MEVQFYWKITPPYAEAIYVTEEQARKIMLRIANHESHIFLKDGAIPTAGLKVEQTDKVISQGEERELIGNGAINVFGHEPVSRVDDNGKEVICWRWAKKIVSSKRWNDYYAKQSYFNLGTYFSTDRVWVAYRKILTDNQTLTEGEEWCDAEDIVKLDKYTASRQ